MPETEKLIVRHGNAADVPTLDIGEIGYDVDTKIIRMGDGTANPPQALMSAAYQTVKNKIIESQLPTSTGASNVYDIQVLPNTLVAPSEGMEFQFIAHQDNTGACTFSVNGGTAMDLVSISGGALSAGKIINGDIVRVVIVDGDARLTISSNAGFNVDPVLTGYFMVWVGAASFAPQVHRPCGAFSTYEVTGNNSSFSYLPFEDDVQSEAVVTFPLPPGYTGDQPIHVRLIFTDPSGSTGDVIWYVRAKTTKNNESFVGAMSAVEFDPQTVNLDTGYLRWATDYAEFNLGAVTAGINPFLTLIVGRLGTDLNDDFADFLWFLGAEVYIPISEANDNSGVP